MVESSRGARADYSGGSLNSLNGANLVKNTPEESSVLCTVVTQTATCISTCICKQRGTPCAHAEGNVLIVC